MIELFVQGGLPWMSALTIEFIGLLLAAWKAPGWVKEIGLIALTTGVFGTVVGFFQISDVIAQTGDIAPAIIWDGVRIALITVIYGIIIYGISLFIRILQKPKLL